MARRGGQPDRPQRIWVPMDCAADNVTVPRQAAASFAAAWLEACPDAVLVTGHGRYPLAWNRRFAALWQLAPGGNVRAVWRQIREQLRDGYSVLAASRHPSYSATVALTRNRWIEIRTAPLDLPATEPQQIWFCRDVTEATRRDHALRETAERAHRLIEHAPDAICLLRVGGDDRFYVDALNAAALRVIAPGVATAQDRPLDALLPDWLLDKVLTGLRQCRDHAETTHYMLTAPPERGGWMRDCAAIPIPGDPAAAGILLIARDVGRRRQERLDLAEALRQAEAAERRVAQAEARLVEAIETLPVGFVLFDRDEKLVLANSQCRNVFPLAAGMFQPGVSFETLLRSHLPDLYDHADPAEIEAYVAARLAAFRSDADQSSELPLTDGRCIRAHDLRTPSGDTVSLRIDITDAKATEADALDARRRLKDAIESLSEGFALYDPAGHLILANSRLREIHAAIDPGFVFSPGSSFEAAMRSGIAASPLEDPEGFIADRLADFRRGEGAWEIHLANGQWLQGTERRMRDGGVVAMRRDITILKQREVQLQAAMSAAMSANKAKSEFLANMSHELRTPLNAIIGFSEMIESETFGPIGNERYRGYIADIHASGQHLLNIINTVLDLARVEAGKIVLNDGIVDVAELIGDCTSLMRERLNRGGLYLKLEVEAGLPALRADPVRLKQIVLNLLSNAIKFTGSGGQITIRAGRNAGGALALAITDTGIGMDANHIAQAFEPFGLVHAAHSRAYEGTGLGLPLSRALAEEHGGEIQLASSLGVGSTATVTLPAARFIGSLVRCETASS